MMHQSSNEDPKYNGPNGPTPLHRVSLEPNIQLTDLWVSQRPDDHNSHQVSGTYTYERGYEERTHSFKFPGCNAN